MSIFTEFKNGFRTGYAKTVAPKVIVTEPIAAEAVKIERVPVAQRIGRVVGTLVRKIQAIVNSKTARRVAKAAVIGAAVYLGIAGIVAAGRWMFAPVALVSNGGEIVATVSKGWMAKMKLTVAVNDLRNIARTAVARIINSGLVTKVRGFHFTRKVVEVTVPVPVV